MELWPDIVGRTLGQPRMVGGGYDFFAERGLEREGSSIFISFSFLLFSFQFYATDFEDTNFCFSFSFLPSFYFPFYPPLIVCSGLQWGVLLKAS